MGDESVTRGVPDGATAIERRFWESSNIQWPDIFKSPSEQLPIAGYFPRKQGKSAFAASRGLFPHEFDRSGSQIHFMPEVRPRVSREPDGSLIVYYDQPDNSEGGFYS